MRILLSLIVFALLAATSLAVTIQSADQKKVSIYNQIGLEDVDRTVDVSKPNVVRETIKISAFNSGDQAQTAIYLAYPKKLVENNLALLDVVLPNKEKLELTNQGFENKLQKDAIFFEVKLNKALNPNEKVSITVNSAFINTVAAFPKQIKQRENQKVLYADNVYLYSPYAVSSQKTTYQIGTTSIESYTDTVKPVDRRGTSIVYGSFSNQKPFAEQQVKLHYQSNAPFVVISQLERIIEISHWGNLAVEEHYDLRHAGAALKGSFSRLDYQRNPAQSSPASFRSIVAKLPIDAADIYYRDRIGNISTSDCKPSGDKKNLEVEILPRYPMFGGWKVKFYIGYNLPLSNYATVDGDVHTLTTKFGTPFDAPVEDLTVKVIIPEGAQNIKVNLPFSIDSESRETLKTYLDTFGRTVVVLKKRNVVEDHNQVFTVTYNFSATSAFQEPALVITALFAFCIVVMVYVRLDLSISKTESQSKAENEARVYEIIEIFSDKHLARDNLYKSFERAIRRGNSEELKSLRATRTTIKTSIRDKILQELSQLDARDFSAKVGVIEKKDDEKFQLLENLSEIVTDKKLTGAKLEARVKEIEKEYDQKTEEINDIFDGFDL